MIDLPPNEREIDSPPAMPSRDGWGGVLATLFILIFFLCILTGPAMGWLVWEVGGISGFDIPTWTIPTVTAVQGGILALILGLMGRFWRRSIRYRGVFQTWALAAVFTVLLTGLRTITPIARANAANLGTVWQIGSGLLFVLLLWMVARAASKRWSRRVDANRWPTFLIAPLILMPFFIFGSLGSPLDIVLQLAAGLVLGLAVGRLAGSFLLPAVIENSYGKGRDLALIAASLFGALLLIAPAYGLFGQTAVLLFVLPPLALLLAAALRWGQPLTADSWPTLAWIIGLVTGGILILTDADELNLFLAIEPGELFRWLLIAAGMAAGIGLTAGIVAVLLRRPLRHTSDGVGSMIASGLWLVGVLVYALAGNPGFYGDRLFVIMAEQADVSAATAIDDLDERRGFVYDTLVDHARTSQAPLLATLDRFYIDHQSYYLVNSIEVEGGPLLRLWLANQPGVARVLDTFDARPLPVPHPTSSGDAGPPNPGEKIWGLEAIGAYDVHELGVTGAGVVVGNSDSGVQRDHPEFADRYRGRDTQDNFNWFDPWSGTASPTDFNGHGTHTLGTVLGSNVGVAPDAEWIACANLQRPLGSPGKYVRCLEFMLAPFPQNGDPLRDGRPELAADVLNNSWACPTVEGCDPRSLQPAVDALRAAGIFVVASAGNEGLGGCGTIKSPIATYDSAFSVGASNEFGDLAEFSSLGPVNADGSGRIKPDVVAPGVDILSAFPESTYAFNDGTSMAGPHVAGVVALIWSANPNLMGDIDATEQILYETAKPLENLSVSPCGSGELPDNLQGYGLVDAFEAVKLAINN